MTNKKIDTWKKETIDIALKQESFKDLVSQYKISKTQLEKAIIKIDDYNNDIKACVGCKGLEYCPKSKEGYVMSLDYSNNNIVEKYNLCKFAIKKQKEDNILKNIKYGDFINEDTLKSIDLFSNSEREPVISKMRELLKTPEQAKGIYLSGSFGVGKTYITKTFAIEFAKRNKTVAFANMPYLCSKFKNSNFKNNDILEKLMEVDYLFLDDIGAEDGIAWFRNELYVIIEKRIQENKPIFFNSNYSILDLAKFYAKQNNIDLLKDKRTLRLIDRIRNSVYEYEVKGANLRPGNNIDK